MYMYIMCHENTLENFGVILLWLQCFNELMKAPKMATEIWREEY